MSTIDELNRQISQSKEHTAKLEKQKRQLVKKEREAKKKLDQRRNYIVGELFCKHFPDTDNLIPGTKEQNAETFKAVDAFLSVLSQDKEILRRIKEKINTEPKTYQPIYRCDSNGNNQPSAQHDKLVQLFNEEVKNG